MAVLASFAITVGSWDAGENTRWGYHPTRNPAVGGIDPNPPTFEIGGVDVTITRWFLRSETGELITGAGDAFQYDELEGKWAELSGAATVAKLAQLRFQSGHLTAVWDGSGTVFSEKWLAVGVDGETVVGQFSTLTASDTADAIASLQGSATLPVDGTETTVEIRDTENGDPIWSTTLTWGTSGSRRGFAAGAVSYGGLDVPWVAADEDWGRYYVQLPQSSGQNGPAENVPNLADDSVLANGSTLVVALHDTDPQPAPTQVEVPDLSGLSRDDAEQAVEDAGLVAAVTTENQTSGTNGEVISQDPAAGEMVDSGSTVNIVVRNLQVAVPRVIDDTEADARTAIEDADLVFAVSATTRSTTDQSIDGTVAVQDPADGTQVDVGSTVTVTLFEYTAPQVAVPTLVGLTETAAETALTTAGLVKGTVTTMTVTDAAQNGLVQSSTPTVGTMVDSGSSVALVIGNYVAPTPTPTTGGLVHVTTLEVVDTGGWIGWDASSTTYDGSSIGDASFTFDGTDIVLTRVDWNQTNEQIRIWAETAAQMTALVGEAWFILAWPVQDRDVTFQLAATGVGTRGHKENAYPNGTVVEGIDATSTAPATVDLYVYSGDNPRGRIDGPYWVV